MERKAAIQMVEDVAATAQKRIVELRQQRQAMDTEMEFYKKDPNKAPMTLRRKIAENDDSIAEQQRFIGGQDDEKRRVHQRFDVELAQLRKLWDEQRGVGAPGAASSAPRRLPAVPADQGRFKVLGDGCPPRRGRHPSGVIRQRAWRAAGR